MKRGALGLSLGLCLFTLGASAEAALGAPAKGVAQKSALVTNSSDALDAFAGMTINPGATTKAACAKLSVLKEKFVGQLSTSEASLEKERKVYETRICEGLGCEQDTTKRERSQAEWAHVQGTFQDEQARFHKLLEKIEDLIEEAPFRRCPEFEGYLAKKRQLQQGEKLMDDQQAKSL